MEAVKASFWGEQSDSQPEVWVCSVSVNLFITLAPLFASSGSFGASTHEELQQAASRGRHPLTHSLLPACGCKQPASHHCCDVSQRWLSCLLWVCLHAPPCSPASLSLCLLSRKCIEGFSWKWCSTRSAERVKQLYRITVTYTLHIVMLTLLIHNCYTNCESESITSAEWDFITDMWRTSAPACLVLLKQNQIHRTKGCWHEYLHFSIRDKTAFFC